MTLKEIMQVIEAYNKRQQAESDKQLAIVYTTANLTATFVSSLLNGKELPTLYETFPTLDKHPELTREKQQELEAQRLTAQWTAFAAAHNAAREKKHRGGALP